MPAWVRPALDEVRGRAELTPADLPLDEQSRLVLCRQAGPGGSAGDPRAEVTRPFRCAAASLGRDEPLDGHGLDGRARSCCSRTTGPGARTPCATPGCPDGLGDELGARASARPGARAAHPPARPPGPDRRDPGVRGVRPPRVALARDDRAHRHPPGARPRRRGARRRTVAGPDAAPRAGLRGLHARQARHVLRRARPPGRRGPGRPPTRSRPGRSRTSAATGSPATRSCCPTGSTTAGSTRRLSRPSPTSTSPVTSPSTTCAAGPASRRRCSTPRSRCAGTSTRPRATAVRFVSRSADGDAVTAVLEVERCRRTPSASGRAGRPRSTGSPVRRPATMPSVRHELLDLSPLDAAVTLLRAAHPGPAFAVTLLAALLGCRGRARHRRCPPRRRRRRDRPALDRLVQRPRRR